MSTGHIPGLFQLPEELLLSILSTLDLKSLYVCQATCRFLRDLLSSSVVTQHVQLTQFAGVLDNPLSPDVIAHRLEQLEQHEKGWRLLTISKTKHVQIPHLPSGIYDLTGGCYFLGVFVSLSL
jgi:hypothetical protein